MRKAAYAVSAMMILITALAISGMAQSGPLMTAHVPFQFMAGDVLLPAGDYAVKLVNPASDTSVVQLVRKDGGASALLQMRPTNSVKGQGAKLVFSRYGDRYFLSQAWTDGDHLNLQAPKSRSERELVAHTGRSIEMVALTTR